MNVRRLVCLLVLPGCMTGEKASLDASIPSVPTFSAPAPPAAEPAYSGVIQQRASYRETQTGGTVFVANGSGDSGRLTQNLISVLGQSSMALRVEPVAWSHGSGRVMADHWDQANQRLQGRRLAAHIVEIQAKQPSQPVYLLGHSSGCAVILAAAESLPPESLEKILLLSPSVCATHDLRPALRASRSGIDSFNSAQDQLVLGLGMQMVGTTDGDCRDAAGLYGFRPVYRQQQDVALYLRLRQHAWDQSVAWTGHTGNHYGCLQPKFLQAYVVPELLKSSIKP